MERRPHFFQLPFVVQKLSPQRFVTSRRLRFVRKTRIPLCRNLHQAFDMGALSIDDNYQILIKTKMDFKESDSIYGIHQLVTKTIKLPKEEKYYPSLEKLAEHRNRFEFS
jgi:hypothetical protein